MGIKMNMTCGPVVSVRHQIFPAGIFCFPVCQTAVGFILDRDCKVRGANDRDLESRVQIAGSGFKMDFCRL